MLLRDTSLCTRDSNILGRSLQINYIYHPTHTVYIYANLKIRLVFNRMVVAHFLPYFICKRPLNSITQFNNYLISKKNDKIYMNYRKVIVKIGKNMKKAILIFSTLLLLGCTESTLKKTPADYVDVFIGTKSPGHTYPGPTLPFGMVQLSPDTRNDHTSWPACRRV